MVVFVSASQINYISVLGVISISSSEELDSGESATIKEGTKLITTLTCDITVGPPAISVKLTKNELMLLALTYDTSQFLSIGSYIRTFLLMGAGGNCSR